MNTAKYKLSAIIIVSLVLSLSLFKISQAASLGPFERSDKAPTMPYLVTHPSGVKKIAVGLLNPSAKGQSSSVPFSPDQVKELLTGDKYSLKTYAQVISKDLGTPLSVEATIFGWYNLTADFDGLTGSSGSLKQLLALSDLSNQLKKLVGQLDLSEYDDVIIFINDPTSSPEFGNEGALEKAINGVLTVAKSDPSDFQKLQSGLSAINPTLVQATDPTPYPLIPDQLKYLAGSGKKVYKAGPNLILYISNSLPVLSTLVEDTKLPKNNLTLVGPSPVSSSLNPVWRAFGKTSISIGSSLPSPVDKITLFRHYPANNPKPDQVLTSVVSPITAVTTIPIDTASFLPDSIVDFTVGIDSMTGTQQKFFELNIAQLDLLNDNQFPITTGYTFDLTNKPSYYAVDNFVRVVAKTSSKIAAVELFIDGQSLGIQPVTSGLASFGIDLEQYLPGSHALEAVGYDASERKYVGSTININFKYNPTPSLIFNLPDGAVISNPAVIQATLKKVTPGPATGKRGNQMTLSIDGSQVASSKSTSVNYQGNLAIGPHVITATGLAGGTFDPRTSKLTKPPVTASIRITITDKSQNQNPPLVTITPTAIQPSTPTQTDTTPPSFTYSFKLVPGPFASVDLSQMVEITVKASDADSGLSRVTIYSGGFTCFYGGPTDSRQASCTRQFGLPMLAPGTVFPIEVVDQAGNLSRQLLKVGNYDTQNLSSFGFVKTDELNRRQLARSDIAPPILSLPNLLATTTMAQTQEYLQYGNCAGAMTTGSFLDQASGRIVYHCVKIVEATIGLPIITNSFLQFDNCGAGYQATSWVDNVGGRRLNLCAAIAPAAEGQTVVDLSSTWNGPCPAGYTTTSWFNSGTGRISHCARFKTLVTYTPASAINAIWQADKKSIYVWWVGGQNVKQYAVYRCPGSPTNCGVSQILTTNTAWDDTGVIAGQTYYYAVDIQEPGGNWGHFTVGTQAVTVPVPTTSVSVPVTPTPAPIAAQPALSTTYLQYDQCTAGDTASSWITDQTLGRRINQCVRTANLALGQTFLTKSYTYFDTCGNDTVAGYYIDATAGKRVYLCNQYAPVVNGGRYVTAAYLEYSGCGADATTGWWTDSWAKRTVYECNRLTTTFTGPTAQVDIWTNLANAITGIQTLLKRLGY